MHVYVILTVRTMLKLITKCLFLYILFQGDKIRKFFFLFLTLSG